MVRMGAAPARASTSKKRASEKKGSEAETGEGATLSVGLVSSAVSAGVPPAEDLPTASEPLPIVPVDVGQAAPVEEEEEDAGPPLKRKRLSRRGALSSGTASKAGPGKEKKGKEKTLATKSGQWEPAIKLGKGVSLGDLDVSRYLAERVTPPVDERFMEKKDNLELGSQLVRLGMRTATMSFAVLQRLETLGQEVQDLHEQVKALKDELSDAKEGRDLLQAQNASLEEEKKAREKEMVLLTAQHEKEVGVFKARQAKAEEDIDGWRKTVRAEREQNKKYRQDCRSAVEARDRAEKTLREVRSSVKKQRIEAIKRWRRRFLYEESLELTCEVTLSVLKKGHELYAPAGGICPSFEDYAEPLIPAALGLSLEDITKKVEEGPSDVPDEELDLSSEEEELPCEDIPSVAPPGPAPLPDEDVLPVAPPDPVPTSSHPPASEASPGYSPGYSPSPSAVCSPPSPKL